MAVTGQEARPGPQKPPSGPLVKPTEKPEVSLQKEQIALLEETRKLVLWKMSILKSLDTISLIEQVHTQEQAITKLMQDELKFKSENRGYIAGANDDLYGRQEQAGRAVGKFGWYADWGRQQESHPDRPRSLAAQATHRG